jgi:hypothetical protein
MRKFIFIFLIFTSFWVNAQTHTFEFIKISNATVADPYFTFDIKIKATSATINLASGNIRYSFNNTDLSVVGGTSPTPVPPTATTLSGDIIWTVNNSTAAGGSDNLSGLSIGLLGTSPNKYVNLGFTVTGSITLNTTGFIVGRVKHKAADIAAPSVNGSGIRVRLNTTTLAAIPAYTNPLPAGSSANWCRIYVGSAEQVPGGNPVNLETEPISIEPLNNECLISGLRGARSLNGSLNGTGASLTNQTTVGATQTFAAGTVCGGNANDDVWYTVTTDSDDPAGGTLKIEVSNSTISPIIEAFTSCTANSQYNKTAAMTNCSASGTLDLLAVPPNTTVYIRVFDIANNIVDGSVQERAAGTFTITSSGTSVALPIELKSFAARVNGANNLIEWVTSSERNVQSILLSVQ